MDQAEAVASARARDLSRWCSSRRALEFSRGMQLLVKLSSGSEEDGEKISQTHFPALQSTISSF